MGRCRISRAWVMGTQMAALVCIGAGGVAAKAVDPALKELFPEWQRTVATKISGGYKDNIALSHAQPESSGFFRSYVEAAALHTPLDGPQWTFLLSAEDTRYFSGKTVDHEDLIFGQAEWRRYVGENWQTWLALDGVYLDQVIDVSITETNRAALPVRGGMFTLRPGARVDFPGDLWFSFETPVSRQVFAETLDDYFEAGPKLTFGATHGPNSESSLGYSLLYRGYDMEPERNLSGAAVPGTTRSSWQHEMLWQLKHNYDARWRSVTKVSFRFLNDSSESGYYDYHRMAISEQLRFRAAGWELSGEVRFAYYQFTDQPVSPTDPRIRDRTDLTFSLYAQRRIAKHFHLFLQYDYEQTLSNLSLDEYRVNTVFGGVMAEF